VVTVISASLRILGMAKKPPNTRKQWTKTDDQKLRKLARGNTPTGLIAHELGRSKDAVYSHASDIGVSLGPANRSPYTRRKR
jgi:hypothetical protein